MEREARSFQVIRKGVVLEFQEEPEGGYTVSVPALPGCISYGETFEEAMDMIKDAMEGWLEVAREKGVPIPQQYETLEATTIYLRRQFGILEIWPTNCRCEEPPDT